MANEVFIFSPERMVPETLPPEPLAATSMNGWQFSSRPNVPYQRRFRVKLHGLRWYLNEETDFYDLDINPPFNAHALEDFYERHQTWRPFDFYHPHLGLLTVKFAAPVQVPAAPVGSGGWLDAVEITLAEHNPVFKSNAPRVKPSLRDLTIDAKTAQSYHFWSATIMNRSTGSRIVATSSDGTRLGVSGSTVSGTFTQTGVKTITLTETLSGTANSPRVSTVALNVVIPAPRNDIKPTLSGDPTIGQSLTVNPGGWAFAPTFTYTWFRDNSVIPGVTGTSYTLTQDDDNKIITVDVRGTNSSGNTTVKTGGVGPVRPVFVPSLDNTYANSETIYANTFMTEYSALEQRLAAEEG